MGENSEQSEPTRRTVLESGAVVAGTTVLGGAILGGLGAVGSGRSDDLVARVDDGGHYARFPRGSDTWKRSSGRFDDGDANGRWLAEPAADGGIRCLVADVDRFGSAGFDLHLGRLRDVGAVTVDVETVQTAVGASAGYFLGLFLDVDGNGDVFQWTDGSDGTQVWDGFGPDAEGGTFVAWHGEETVDDVTEFQLFNVGGQPTTATLGELKAGSVSGIDGTTIDGDTNAVLYVGVSTFDGTGTEEIRVRSIDVERS